MQQQQQQQPFPPDQSANRQFNFSQGYSIEKITGNHFTSKGRTWHQI